MLQVMKLRTAVEKRQVVPCTAGKMTGVVYSNGDVSLCAIRALGRLATLQAFEALLSLLGQEDDAHLTPLSQARIVERISEPWAQPYLRPALAATAAASGERPAGVQVLGPESHEQNPGHNVGDRQALGLMRALAVSGVSVPIGELEPWLRHGSIDERIAAIRASAACCGEVSAPMLAAVEDDSAVVRAQAVRAIGQVTVPPALLQATLDVLTAQATDRNWWVRGYAMSSLATLGAPGLAVLRATAESDDRFAAQRASEQLAITETEARR
jgi:HEAT repeat protein